MSAHLTDPERVQAWLNGLAKLDLDPTATQLIARLQALGKAQLPLPQRERLLKLHQPLAIQLSEALESRLLDSALPLSDPDRKTAHKLLELSRQMTINYLQAVLAPGFLDAPASKLKPSLTLAHALDWLARLARHRAQVYHPPGEGFWKTVYRVYRLLETHALLPPAPGSGEISPFRAQLLRVLLFASCGPGRFRPRELQRIDQLLARFAGYAEIHRRPAVPDQKARFFFDCEASAPPRALKLLPSENRSRPGLRFLYPHPVVQRLLESVSTPNDGQAPREQKLALRLAHVLGAPRQRKWRRMPEQRECLLLVGLAELIAALLKEGQANQELITLLPKSPPAAADAEFSADFKLLPLESEPAQRNDLRSEASAFQQLAESAQSDAQALWTRSLNPIPGHGKIRFPGRFADVCAQGYCLIWLDRACTQLKIGEILGINHTQGEIEVGAIRWLRQEPQGEIAVGVELLSFAASLVVVSLPMDLAPPRREWGLLLPAQPAIDRPACLLAPACRWRSGQWVEIYRSRVNKQTYNLKQRLDATPAYELFALENIGG
ncbi:cyclic-di-GMP receptor FimW [Methylothermus subterraneus]